MPSDSKTGPDESVEDDVVSDPARDDRPGSDWSTEGGATDNGPATDTGDALHGSDPEPPNDGDGS